MSEPIAPQTAERWGIYELTLTGPADGNPFTEVAFGAAFSYRHRTVDVDGFYDGIDADGRGVYRVRFMPDTPGAWRVVTRSNRPELDGVVAALTCTPASAGNHGPVAVAGGYHFAYADGAPYRQVGTTCYAWAHQGDALEEQTLATLAEAPFNKIRMCVFPKDYTYSRNEPAYYPFERGEDGGWDWTRFSPAFWRHFETRVGQLRDLGIVADLILFHPYDRWGFADMGAEADDRYLRYACARLAAYRNVWWSMANEYDLMRTKTMADWDRFFRIVQESDPYGHPRSVHNCRPFYDHSKPWVTHLSVQRSTVEQTREWREQYGKPVVIDECCYEGDVPQRWGNISAQEMTRRFWEATVRGGYCGHGETYLHPDDILWWSKGGVLHGQSPARLAFLRQVLEEGPAEGLDPVDGVVGSGFACAGRPGAFYLAYTGLHQPARVTLNLPEEARFQVDVIDTWAMTVEPLPEPVSGAVTVDLPARPYTAIRARRVGE